MLFARSRSARRLLNALSVVSVALVVFFTVRHFLRHGWPLHHANVLLVGAAAGLFLAAYGFKAFGWGRLFTGSQRPSPFSLAVAGGAAALTGIALRGASTRPSGSPLYAACVASAPVSERSACPSSYSA